MHVSVQDLRKSSARAPWHVGSLGASATPKPRPALKKQISGPEGSPESETRSAWKGGLQGEGAPRMEHTSDHYTASNEPQLKRNRVRELREDRLMTQAQLAKKARVALRTIHSVEKRRIK